MTTNVEPAIKSYFFGKGYTDLRDVIIDSWRKNIASANDFFSKVRTTGEWWENAFSIIFWGGTGVSVMLFGTIFLCAVSLLHIIFLGVFFSIIYFGFTIVWTVEWFFLFFRRFFSACPYCHKKNTLPEYLCDSCGKVHARLLPNSYGVFHHKCICGQKLPATFFVNRGRLQAKCPDCSQYLKREHIESRRIFIPILGGPDAGKSTFMFSIVRKLIEENAKKIGYTAEFIDDAIEAKYKHVMQSLKRGIAPGKTTDAIPTAFTLALKLELETKWLMYLYDPSGEVYTNSEYLAAHHYQKYLSGTILIVDPFSISVVRRDYDVELSKASSSLKPSHLSADEALSRVLLSMEESFGLSKTGKINTPLAVVISKIDAFNLEQVIGEIAVEKIFSEGKTGRNKAEIRNNLIKKQLTEWGEASLIHQIDTRFNNVRYYTCSALGRTPDSSGTDYVPYHVIEPILWICNSVSPKDFELKTSEQT